jgi:type IV secretory pathway TraG/TraD family ATPase VirD4
MAQRYLEHVAQSMRAAGVPVTPVSLMAHMSPDELERTARVAAEARTRQDTDDRVPSAEDGPRTEEYVQCLTERQKRDLAGVRDRLSILAESDVAPWLDPGRAQGTIDLGEAVADGWVVYFALDADRRPLLAQMLGAAIVSDLVTVAAERQHDPRATAVLIDEFAALAAEQVSRLFGRSKSAGISMVLATQELADLASVGRGVLHKQVMGNLASTIAFRQNVPESAELIAGLAGTEPAWVRTQWTRGLLAVPSFGRGMRRRGREYAIEPTQIMRLDTGEALVVAHTGGQPATVARMCHPGEARLSGACA